mmetsp:Transcript_9246/g.11667  ORF Transcript_9246/g.11667 Transcript_9246/m.11667 type:complete len:83 (-) Transcript_9246:1506-1754(-)
MTPEEEIEILKLKAECQDLTKLLKEVQDEELNLISQNKGLAREALNAGYKDIHKDGGSNSSTQGKRSRKKGSGSQAEVASSL